MNLFTIMDAVDRSTSTQLYSLIVFQNPHTRLDQESICGRRHLSYQVRGKFVYWLFQSPRLDNTGGHLRLSARRVKARLGAVLSPFLCNSSLIWSIEPSLTLTPRFFLRLVSYNGLRT